MRVYSIVEFGETKSWHFSKKSASKRLQQMRVSDHCYAWAKTHDFGDTWWAVGTVIVFALIGVMLAM